MRDIRFRAWDKNSEEMVKVKTIDFDNNGLGCVVDASDINLDKSECIVMQYAGLKDKNGVEIYEGDVIANPNTKGEDDWYISHHVVEWFDTGFMGKQLCSSGSHIGLEHWTHGKNGYEVIGNIYENPELLEEKQ